jgi:membrane protein YqaA with SNARE-associated domain
MKELRVKLARYKLLSIFLISVLVAVYVAENDTINNFLHHLGSYGYVGALLAGFLFVSTFTTVTSIVLLGILAQDLNPFVLALIGGVGAMLGDLLVYRFLKNNVDKELMLIFGEEGEGHVKKILKSKYIAWTLPIIGMLIIASPLPDELGLGLLGFSKVSETKLMAVSYVSNVFGILAIAAVTRVLV